jgi:hypothetical protein
MFSRTASVILIISASSFLPLRVDAAPLPQTAGKEDARLTRKVTVHADRIYVGELLEQLGKAADVSVSASKNTPGAADQMVTIYAANVPLDDVMDALYGLLRYCGAEWHWVRIRRGGTFAYVLQKPRPAQLLGDNLSEEASRRFDWHAESVLEVIDAEQDGRPVRKPLEKAAVEMVGDPFTRGGLKLFAGAGPQVREAVLKSHGRVRLPLEQLGPEARTFVRSIYDGPNAPIKVGEGAPAPNPAYVDVYLRRFPGTVSPVLMIKPEGLPGFGYLGGNPLERDHRERLRASWELPGDGSESAVERATVPPPIHEAKPDRESPLTLRIRQLAEASKIPIVARLPLLQQSDPGAPHALEVKAYLQKLRSTPPYLQHKWRRQFLLFTDPAWYDRPGEVTVPLETVKWLRSRQAKSGILTFDDLAQVASQLSPRQLISLSREFAVMSQVARWRDLFALATSPPMRKSLERGLPIAGVRDLLLALAVPEFEPHLLTGTAVSVRIRVEDPPGGDTGGRSVQIEVLARNGKRLGGTGFRYSGDRPRDAAAQ